MKKYATQTIHIPESDIELFERIQVEAQKKDTSTNSLIIDMIRAGYDKIIKKK